MMKMLHQSDLLKLDLVIFSNVNLKQKTEFTNLDCYAMKMFYRLKECCFSLKPDEKPLADAVHHEVGQYYQTLNHTCFTQETSFNMSPLPTNARAHGRDMIGQKLHKGIEGQNFLKGLVKAKSSPAIALCANFVIYNGVVNGFKVAMVELKHDPMMANYDAGVISDEPATCERALADERTVDPAISAVNNHITLLSAVAPYAIDKVTA
ncbi:hypothetical protein JHK85_056731 [Glycine max]|uniref:Pectinesterase inhibitor domain-containing protein n=1 Tax=Glycine soja TaxID=3848 RepID=A0A445F2F6_GLYSO|nr:hypothetical protein JHK86_055721 [Glycine max]KAG4918450.1 hypothetical protein JHK85_056731 [Glycine max]RZB43025.1 hypothetical protein D0Y65_053581 [Glycine soja]